MNNTLAHIPIPWIRIFILLAAVTLLLFGIYSGDAALIRIESATL